MIPVSITGSEPRRASAQVTIDRWLAREREVRLLLAQPGKMPVREISRTAGLEFMERIIRGELPSAPIFHTLDFVPVECESGLMVFQGTPKADFYNTVGTVHGGYIATLLDSALGCAVHTRLSQGFGLTTIELNVRYLRPVTDLTGPMRAEGRVINLSRQIGTAEARLVDAAGKLYAHATATCLVFPLPDREDGGVG
jgi:uncharacterized protein (TIGR00369 family)